MSDEDHHDPDSTWGFREGTPLAPGYLAWELLAAGKRFEMWAAWSLERLTPVCVKIPRRDHYTDGALNALRREYTATSACAHPAIPRAFDLQLDGAVPHLVLEYIEGDALGDFIDEHGPMDSEAVVYFGLQVLAALRHLHDRGFVHHDLKPANIMIRGDRPIVVDFDLALPIGSQRSRTKPRGTHDYMSPEQIRCAPASPAMDIFALGAVLYRVATGTSPFRIKKASTSGAAEAEQPRRYVQMEGGRVPVPEAAPTLAPAVAAAIEELLTVDPRHRPATAEAAIALLTNAWTKHGEPLWPEYVTATLDRSSKPRTLSLGPSRTEVLTGDGVALDWCRSLSPTERSRTVIVVDQDIENHGSVAALCTALGSDPAARVVSIRPDADGLEALDGLASALAVENAETVVAVGGAQTLDLARIASLLSVAPDHATSPLQRSPLQSLGPGGLLTLPDSDGRGPTVVAIPTALGTDIAANPVANFTQDGSRRSVASPALQPALALFDPSMTAALSDRLVEQGLLESLLRYVGPILAGPSPVPTADDDALANAAALAGLLRANRFAALSSDQRLEAAIRVANIRRGFALHGRDPLAPRSGTSHRRSTTCQRGT